MISGFEEIKRLMSIVGGTNISPFLLAPSGHGKTGALLKTIPPLSLLQPDFYFTSLVGTFTSETPPLRIICTDLGAGPFAHRAQVADLTMGIMIQSMTDGITELPDGRKKHVFKNPIFMRYSVGATPEFLRERMNRWIDRGLVRRLLPIQWCLSEESKIKMLKMTDLETFTYEPVITNRRHVPHELQSKTKDKIKEYAMEKVKSMIWRWRTEQGHKMERPVYTEYHSLYKILLEFAKFSDMETLERLLGYLSYTEAKEI